MKNYESFLKRWQDGISKKVTRVYEKINSDNSLGGKLKMSTHSYVRFPTDDKCANFSQKKGKYLLTKMKINVYLNPKNVESCETLIDYPPCRIDSRHFELLSRDLTRAN